MYRILTLFALLLVGSMLNAQLPVLQWVKVMQKTGAYTSDDLSNGRSLTVDPTGNVISVGLLTNTVDFDPGPGLYTLSGTGPFNRGLYVSKLDANGQFIWAKQFPVIIEFADIEVAVDPTGNVYVSAYLSNPADMDPGPGVLNCTPLGAKDAFIVKLDPNGNLVWFKQFGGPGDTVVQPSSIQIDDSGNVYTSGIFINTVDFDPGAGVVNLSTSNHWEGYISKLNSKGDFVWIKRIGDFSGQGGSVGMRRVVTDPKGNCYFSGTFSGLCDFDPDAGRYTFTSNGLMDGFIASFDSNGKFRWVKQVGNSTLNNYVNHNAICLDANNNVYTSGTFIGTHDFDPGAGTFTLTSLTGTCPYLLKLDELGNFSWAKKIALLGNGTGVDVCSDISGNIYSTANYVGDIDFGPGSGNTVFKNCYDDAVITKFSPDGQLLYAAPFLRTPDGYSLLRRIVSDPAANLYITGYFYGNVDFDPGPSLEIIPYNGSNFNPMVIKLAKCSNPSFSSLTRSTCDSFQLNGKYYSNTGTYLQTIPNAAGCDSIITLHLTQLRKSTLQQLTFCSGQKFFAGGQFQTTDGSFIDTLKTTTGCDSIVTTVLTFHPLPAPSLGANRSICTGTTLILNPGNFNSYLWQDGSTTAAYAVTNPGTYSVTVTNTYGCSSTAAIVIPSLYPLPTNFLKPIDSVCAYGKLVLVPSGNFSEYKWSTGAIQRQIETNLPGEYRLAVKDANGCVGSETIQVYAKKCLKGIFVPSAFTPDGNGRNDVFKPVVLGNVRSYHFEIYNRWGGLVFSSNDSTKGWDGREKNKAGNTAVYVWVCSYQFENEAASFQKGTVVLIH